MAISLAATLGVSTAAWCAPGNPQTVPHAPLSATDIPTHPGMGLKGTNPASRSYSDEPGDATVSHGATHHSDGNQVTEGTDSNAPAQVHAHYSAHSAVLDTLGVSHDISSGGSDYPTSLGLTVRPLTQAERQANGLDGGLMVTDVSGGLGQRAGFQPGDVVLSLDGVDLTSTDQFYRLIQKLPHDRPVPVLVHRPNTNLFLPLGAPARR